MMAKALLPPQDGAWFTLATAAVASDEAGKTSPWEVFQRSKLLALKLSILALSFRTDLREPSRGLSFHLRQHPYCRSAGRSVCLDLH